MPELLTITMVGTAVALGKHSPEAAGAFLIVGTSLMGILLTARRAVARKTRGPNI